MSRHIIYGRQANRLAQFRSWDNNANAWEARWSPQNIEKLLASHQLAGNLGEYEEIFVKHLPHHLPIVEAGCGLGQLVMALHARGYQIEGVDFTEPTLRRIKQVAPELNMRIDDVYHLSVADGYYGGYISIGVFEHCATGPQAGLQEVRRVLADDGVALISVPYLNLRREKMLDDMGQIDGDVLTSEKVDFYQFYYSVEEFTSLCAEAGLEVVECFPYAVYAGLTRENPAGVWLAKHGFFAWQLHKRIIAWCKNAPMWARWRWGHMMMYVCKPVVD